MNGAAITMNWMDLLKRTVNAWIADKALRLSAALAYYSVFSIAPLLVITIAVAGMILGDEAVAGQLKAEMKTYIGAPAAGALQSMVESASKPADSLTATITGFVVLLLGASGVFSALKDALNTIWEVKEREDFDFRAFAREKVLNFGMVLVIGFLLLVSLLLSTAIASLNHRLESVVALPPIVWTIATFFVSMAVATTLFAWIFKVLPDVRTHWRDVWTGAVLTALLFEIGKTGLSWYLGRESTANAYGAAGSVVLLLLWVYYASCILLFGAEFTQVYAHARGRIIGPEVNAEWVGADERLNQGMDEHGHAGKESPAMPQKGGLMLPAAVVSLQQDSGPKAVLRHVAEHPLLVMGGAFAVGLIPTLLLMQRRRVTRRATSKRQNVPVRPVCRNTPASQIAGELARRLIPLVVMPFIEKAIERHFRLKPSSSSES